ncbi:MAG: acyl-CoA dehydratase activase-related protein, partial [Desulfobacterales bacterium]
EWIADIALKGRQPPNFNDQCAAFIASDIKTAIHESIAHADIIAGLVYSICMNYTNRVKGNRPVGAKIFMQGGVCYNRAVPLAMAALVGKPIVVPPEPGLMGAFGVALEIEQRIASNFLEPGDFDLDQLASREVHYGKSFVCQGGKERCDRKCSIARVEVAGEKHAFGGACNRYYNLRHKLRYDVAKLDMVRARRRLIFNDYGIDPQDAPQPPKRGTIALNRSFLVNSYYPLYANFFSQLGFEPVLPDTPHPTGIDRRGAAFCYPAELAHGYFYSLLEAKTRPDLIFLPHFKSIPCQEEDGRASQVCPLVQGETFYLTATFRRELERLKASGTRVLAPMLDMHDGLANARSALVETARTMGISRREAQRGFEFALRKQQSCFDAMLRQGRETLAALERNPDQTAVVLFARPYNGYVEEAHMGIPHKLASRGVTVLPLDFLPLAGHHSKRHMYWGMGQLMLKAGRLVADHPQLFGTYITNFSCGPDSFILGYFRDIMGRKPSLTLELDSHTADAGLETRIEAFLDIVAAYRRLKTQAPPASAKNSEVNTTFQPARTQRRQEKLEVITSAGERLPLNHPRVTLLFPSMGRLGTEALAAIARGAGLNAKAHPPADELVLKTGRAHSSCKECLPLILTTGTLLNYINNGRRSDEVLVYFMPTGSGPCRFGQYYIYMEDLIRRMEIADVAMLALTSENTYSGLGKNFERNGWWGVVISDGAEDIRSMLLANAQEPKAALETFEAEWQAILKAFEMSQWAPLEKQLEASMARLKRIPLKRPPAHVPTVALTGEIFVRRDGLSRRYITEHLAREGFATTCAPIAEWVRYTQYLVDVGLAEESFSLGERLRHLLRKKYMTSSERRIKSILARSG